MDKHLNSVEKLVVVELEARAIVDLVVLKRDVVFEDGVPFMNPDLLGSSARLRRDQLLQVANPRS